MSEEATKDAPLEVTFSWTIDDKREIEKYYIEAIRLLRPPLPYIVGSRIISLVLTVAVVFMLFPGHSF